MEHSKKKLDQLLEYLLKCWNLKHQRIWTVILILLFFSSCEKLLEVEEPISLITRENVFKDDATATSAITGIYTTMIGTTSFASGSIYSITALSSLSSDDLANFEPENYEFRQFYENQLISTNSYIEALWNSSYQSIYQCNSAIESLNQSSGLTSSVKDQLLGEVLFIRAFCYFNLVNCFGDVPLILTTDYKQNSKVTRVSSSIIYDQIIKDLTASKDLTRSEYPSVDRVRVNRATVNALLSRVYLYLKDWQNAKLYSSAVINDNLYAMEQSLSTVFVASSQEAIWQLRQTIRTANTWEGFYLLSTGVPQFFHLTPSLVNSFETSDQRRASWVRTVTAAGKTYYYPFKYKIRRGGPGSTTPVPLTEYSMVFRLAEQYLIRAEANAQLNLLPQSIEDIDKIRARAGIILIKNSNPTINKQDLLLAIEKERRHEFFTEWGHRWYDLKRTERATVVLAPTKMNFSQNDLLYPIPSKEFLNNPNLGSQNPGY